MEEVESRLAAYQPVETDPLLEAEMQRIIHSGMSAPRPLPDIPPAIHSRATQARRPSRGRRSHEAGVMSEE